MKHLSLWWLSFFCIAFASSAWAKVSDASSIQRELREAETLAIRGEVDAAVAAYREILRQGIDHPDIRYNLGTLRLQQEDLGRAVLHLQTALRVDPRLEDARHNLDIALAARVDQITTASPRNAVESLRWEEWSASQVWFICFGIAFFAASVLAIGAWLPYRKMRVWSYRLCAVSSLAAIALGWTGYRLGELRQREEAVVLADELPARMGPAQDAAASFTAHAGLNGYVMARENGFVRLRLENGLDAWFPQDSLASLGTLPPSAD